MPPRRTAKKKTSRKQRTSRKRVTKKKAASSRKGCSLRTLRKRGYFTKTAIASRKAASRKAASRKAASSRSRCSSKNVRTGKIQKRVVGGRANGGRWVFTGSTAKGNLSAKFWEMNVSGRTLTTRWGRLGTQGLQKSKTYTCDSAARAAALALVKSKEAKGYRRH